MEVIDKKNQLEQFQRVLRDWLVRNQLDGDLYFYGQEAWRSRGEEFLNSADFVVVTEGGLSWLLNYRFDHPKVEELQDLCDSFGYWFDLGHAWSVGFYPIGDSVFPRAASSYADKLRDPRWIKKALAVKRRAEDRCEDCGTKTTFLEAHHCWYRYGLEPWQYPLDAFRALCPTCHEERTPIEHQLRAFTAKLSKDEVASVHEGLRRLFHWYERKAARKLLESLGPVEGKMEAALLALRANKTEPGAT